MTTTTRAENDFYRTPEEDTSEFLRTLVPMIPAPTRILEPAAGDGAMLGPLREAWPDATIDAFDIAPQHPAVIERPFWTDDAPGEFDLVFTNPPYIHAEQFARYGLAKVRRGGHVVMLLRISFVGSDFRGPFFEEFMPWRGYVLPHRPNFRGVGYSTDMADSVWFVWKKDGKRRRFMELYRL